jgi:hypothetical protein
VTVKAGSLFAFFIVANRDEFGNGAKGELFRLGEVVLHGVLVVIVVMDALVRSFVPPP